MLLISFIKANIVIIKDFLIEFICIALALNSSEAKHTIFFNFFEYNSYINIVPILVKAINKPSKNLVSSIL